MKIKCVRCEKELDSPNPSNAKYIINRLDKRTYGVDWVELQVKARLSNDRVKEILKEFKLSKEDFLKSEEIYPDEYGRRYVVTEKTVRVPKTAIVCLGCLEEADDVIW